MFEEMSLGAVKLLILIFWIGIASILIWGWLSHYVRRR